MTVSKDDLQKSKSALATHVHNFVYGDATFDLGEYEVEAEVHYVVTYKVIADSAEEAEKIEFNCDECDGLEKKYHEVRSVKKVHPHGLCVVNSDAVKNLIANLFSVIEETKTK